MNAAVNAEFATSGRQLQQLRDSVDTAIQVEVRRPIDVLEQQGVDIQQRSYAFERLNPGTLSVLTFLVCN